MDLHLAVAAGGGRRAGLERALRDAVRNGRLAPGERLPATRQLAEELGVSRNTVKAAYDQLVAEGYLTARQGSGTRVAALPPVETGPPPGTGEPARALRFDLRPGSPDVGAFPAAAWLRALRAAIARAPSPAYDYGDPRGRIELRTALSGYLGRARGVAAPPEHIVITSGYVQGLALLTRVLDGGPVAMEDPGLPFHRDVVRRHGGAVVPLEVDRRGACLPPGDCAAVVVTPAHQYPTGVTLHPERRRALTEWARARGGLIVEDDYDGEFRYDRQPVGALQGMAPGQVAYLGTASKTLGPALRLGWMVLPPHLVDAVADAKLHSDHHTEVLGQLALAELIDSSHAYDRHVRSCRLRYRRRRDLLLGRLGAHRVRGIAAGLHALVEVDDEDRVLARAEGYGLAVGRLADHWHTPGGDRPQGLVVGYGTPREGAYREALEVLARALDEAGLGH
ncbi:PLP-dependent aminotransferase family protein [Streptomyces sp. M7]|uniref:MocR-like pyridoxine biosynthesis transcription factor PdxR n=1 Tax=Streptomyces sp. M7 TaxID=255705 RepID=UPI000E1D0ECE|nr:PLP-dependent aminotransferase family protein [Streptomyces sp. M7]RDS66609.1 PLP-dependent aminotransferase family protein [Streptomyces sp. M7]